MIDIRLASPRLLLTPLTQADVPALMAAAGAREIADTTISVPHPLPADEAHAWVARETAALADRHSVTLAIRLPTDGILLGMVALRAIDRVHRQAELSFWLGVAHQRRGYAAEAARTMLHHAFHTEVLHRVEAYHMVRNAPSGRLLARLGFREEGLLRARVWKWGQPEDVLLWALLRTEWVA